MLSGFAGYKAHQKLEFKTSYLFQNHWQTPDKFSIQPHDIDYMFLPKWILRT